MEIDFLYEDNGLIDESYESIYLKIIETALNHLNIQDDIEMSCVFLTDDQIHEMNRDYRNIDRSTDVISFALEDSDSPYVEGMPRSIGDIFISVDHAKMQANEYGHSLKREMCFLFTHGLLHLLGYDHMLEDEEKIMFGLQDEILKLVNIPRE